MLTLKFKNYITSLLSLVLLFGFTAEAQLQKQKSLIAEQYIGIGTTAANNGSAALQVDSITKGILPPRMTTTQRDAVVSPLAGTFLFNSTTGQMNVWDGSAWSPLGGIAPMTPSRVVITNGSGLVTTSSVTSTDILQMQLDVGELFNRAPPQGGTTGQVLAKNSNIDFDYVWQTPAASAITALTGDVSASGTGSVVATLSSAITNNINGKLTNPMTTDGDLITRASGVPARIAIGTSGHVLTSNGTAASWQAPVAGFANPMTTLGDVIYGGASGAATRLPGNTTTTKQFFGQTGTGSVSAAPTWSALAVADLPTVTAVKGGTGQTSYTVGDFLYADTTTTLAKRTVASGARGHFLSLQGSSLVPTWVNPDDLNYFDNMGAEADTGLCAAYNDGAVAIPIDGTGGTPTWTLSRNTTNPLRGAGDFLMTKPASNVQGQGLGCDFVVAYKDMAQPTRIDIDFDYLTTGFGDGELVAYVYDATGGMRILNNDQNGAMRSTGGLPAKYKGYFYTSTNQANYRLVIHQSNASNVAAGTLRVDNLNADLPALLAQGAVITPWRAYSPTITGFGTPTSPTFEWRQVGENIEVRGFFISGTPTGVTAGITLPNGYLQRTGYAEYVVGTWYKNLTQNGATKAGTIVHNPGSNTVNMSWFETNGTVSPNDAQLANSIVGFSGQYVTVRMAMPVQGLGAGTPFLSSTEISQQVARFSANKSATQLISSTASTKITWNATPLTDSVLGYDSANNRYVIKRDGRYTISTQIGFDADNTSGEMFTSRLYLNGTQVKATGLIMPTYGTIPMSLALDLKVNDYLELFVQSSADTSYTIGNNLVTWFNVTQQPDFSVLSGMYNQTPTVTRILSGSGTYNIPAGVTYLRVRMVGGGGGGGGSGASAGDGGAGTATTFGSSLLTANGGAGGRNTATSATPALGGTASVNLPAVTLSNVSGGGGGTGAAGNVAYGAGGSGGGTGIAPTTGNGYGGGNLAGAANSGAGGGGGGGGATAVQSGNGGGGGGYLEATINAPASSYAYVVGGGGAAGTIGTNGSPGMAGGSGIIIVEEYYQSGGFAAPNPNSSGYAAVKTVTTTSTLSTGDTVILCNATAGAVTLGPVACAGLNQKRYTVKKIDASGNACIFDPNASETVDGTTTNSITTQYQAREYICDGTAWYSM